MRRPAHVRRCARGAGLAALAVAGLARAAGCFIVPEIDTAPHSGITLGVIPTCLATNEHGEIERIVAPDVIHSQYFGWGARGRVFAYPSPDTQWSVTGGLKQRVEREFDARYADGQTRSGRYSWSLETIYDRSGTTRFFGLGNQSLRSGEAAYVDEQARIEVQLGLNFSRSLQLSYLARFRSVDVEPGVARKLPSIEQLYAAVPGVGRERVFEQRLMLSQDTRDSALIPRVGGRLAIYGGFAAQGAGGDVGYDFFGAEVRHYWPVGSRTTLAAHGSLRYTTAAARAPFWALASLGGDRSVLGEREPLRAFGDDRYVDRNCFASGIELRKTVAEFDALTTHLSLEIAPFADVGKVYAGLGVSPLSRLHKSLGIGIRGLASPSVVGYVDIGYGPDRAAVFSGINYPF
jgi:outer membrane protein assembly factor BamA